MISSEDEIIEVLLFVFNHNAFGRIYSKKYIFFNVLRTNVKYTKHTVLGHKKGSKLNPIRFYDRRPWNCGLDGFIYYFWLMAIVSRQKLRNEKCRFWLQKGVKIGSGNKIFWCATTKLWVFSFFIFDFIKTKTEKRKISFLVTKRDQKLNPTRFCDRWPPICG